MNNDPTFNPEHEQLVSQLIEDARREFAAQSTAEPSRQHPSQKPQWAFFAADGSYGDASNLVILDVAAFTSDDWDTITHATDNDRLDAVWEIAEHHGVDLIQLESE